MSAKSVLHLSIVHLGATGTGVTGIFGLLLCLNEPVKYIIMFVISAGVSFVLTWLFGYKDGDTGKAKSAKGGRKLFGRKTSAKSAEVKAVVSGSGAQAGGSVAVATAIECEPGVVYAPVAGKAVDYTEIPDPTFAAGILGKGVGIFPSAETVVAPFDGEIVSVTGTRHAVGLKSPDGLEVLIHIGVDTVNMQGEGFTCFVSQGDQVKAGDKLVTFSKEAIAAAGYSDCVAVLLVNSAKYETVACETGDCDELSRLIHV